MKILVTGAGGQLGYDVCRELERREIPHFGPSSSAMDITDRAAVRETIRRCRPDAVIHCAAYTAVNRAEEEPERAFRINGQGTRNLAEACREAGAKLLYISTDYVFPGTGTSPHESDAPTGPINIYGKSKLAGEEAVRALLERCFVVRTSWVFGIHGNNFVKTMLRLSETQREIQVVNDQIGSPTYTADLAPLLCDMVQTERYGVYHATNEGLCSWAQFANAIFQEAGRETAVIPVSTAERAEAVRPLNSRLSKRSLTDMGFSLLPPWQDALARYLAELRGYGEKAEQEDKQ